MRWIVPPIEFSSGTTPCVARFFTTASNTSSKRLARHRLDLRTAVDERRRFAVGARFSLIRESHMLSPALVRTMAAAAARTAPPASIAAVDTVEQHGERPGRRRRDVPAAIPATSAIRRNIAAISVYRISSRSATFAHRYPPSSATSDGDREPKRQQRQRIEHERIVGHRLQCAPAIALASISSRNCTKPTVTASPTRTPISQRGRSSFRLHSVITRPPITTRRPRISFTVSSAGRR